MALFPAGILITLAAGELASCPCSVQIYNNGNCRNVYNFMLFGFYSFTSVGVPSEQQGVQTVL